MAEKAAKDTVGCCKKAVVKLDRCLAITCLILNIFFPGVGTMVSACGGKDFNSDALIFGILQLLTAFLIVGWIWSIVHGVWLVDKAS